MKKLKLTWNHVDDLDVNLTGTMQLITIKAHNAAKLHTGSHCQLEELFNIIDTLA